MTDTPSGEGGPPEPYIKADVNMSWRVDLPEDYDEDQIRSEDEFVEVLSRELGVDHRDEISGVEIDVSREVIEEGTDTDQDDLRPDGGQDRALVVLECPECDYVAATSPHVKPLTSCPACEIGLEEADDRDAHRCPGTAADIVITTAGEDCEYCGDVELATDGGQDTGLVDIAFDDHHVEPILEGEKTVTIRYDFEHDLGALEQVRLVDEGGDLFAIARVTTQFESRADWVSFADFAGHERYLTTGDLLGELEEYYPDAEIAPGTVLDVIAFQVEAPEVIDDA